MPRSAIEFMSPQRRREYVANARAAGVKLQPRPGQPAQAAQPEQPTAVQSAQAQGTAPDNPIIVRTAEDWQRALNLARGARARRRFGE
jgi:hypothetical protein